jgi:Fe-S cluster assembly scaffold protein SufB
MAKITFGSGITLTQTHPVQFDDAPLSIGETIVDGSQTIVIGGSGSATIHIVSSCTLTVICAQNSRQSLMIRVAKQCICTIVCINTVDVYEQARLIVCEPHSHVTCITIDSPTNFGVSVTHAQLLERSVCIQKAITLATQNSRHELRTISEHVGAQSESDIATKTLVSHSAHSLCTGLVKIHSTAQGSKGYEHQKALLLSPSAKAFAIPNLEIQNHDVACTHGSSIGRVDPAQIFYLQSKGLTKQQAILLIAQAFLGEFHSYMSEELALTLQEQLLS